MRNVGIEKVKENDKGRTKNFQSLGKKRRKNEEKTKRGTEARGR
jgi:hypothetical protein